jgi:hypothetical protein
MSVPDTGEELSNTKFTACSFNYNNIFALLHLNILSGNYQMLIIYTSICILNGSPEEHSTLSLSSVL